MEPYAVVETGGKQYRVSKGDALAVELLEGEAGQSLELASILAVSDGNELKIGTPYLTGAKVVAEIVKHQKAPKVVAFKKKRRKGYKRKVGHRQPQTMIRVTAIA
jgi:large subunit ribosomal protein L21